MNSNPVESERSKLARPARDDRRLAGSAGAVCLEEWGRVLTWLGGTKFLFPFPQSPADTDDRTLDNWALAHGAITSLVHQLKCLTTDEIAQLLGVSSRTLRRISDSPQKRAPKALEARAWTVARTLAKASDIFGSKEEAERWFVRPAMGLDQRRPVDLAQSVDGAQLMSDFLGRLEYGVYC